MVKFGPGGNSKSFYAAGKKSTLEAPSWVKDFGLDAYEYQGGQGIRGSIDSFKKLGEEAKKADILLSVHAPYFISLSGIEEEKRLGSLRYIKQSVDAAEAMGADTIVIHTGSAAKISRAEALGLAKDTVYRALNEFPDTRVRFGLETMGKLNQLGTLEEVLDICRIDPRLCPVVDFGHLNARNLGSYFVTEDDYLRVFDLISTQLGARYAETLHCHFSKIQYTSSGEKCHLTFEDQEFGPPFEPLMKVLAKLNISPRIICESDGTMAEDALTMKKQYLSEIKQINS